MIYRKIIVVIACLSALCEGSTSEYAAHGGMNGDYKPLRVAIADNVPSTIVGGERFGYTYGLLEAYATELGSETGISVTVEPARLLHGENTDLSLFIADDIPQNMRAIHIYTAHYVMLARQSDNMPHTTLLSETVGNGKVIFPEGFLHTAIYDSLLDSLHDAELSIAPAGSGNLVQRLADGEFDFLVCEAGEAYAAMRFTEGVDIVHEFTEGVDICAAFAEDDGEEYRNFTDWLAAYEESGTSATMFQELSLETERQLSVMKRSHMIVGGISEWDSLLRDIGEREGVDWRLLSAIAYKESRFDNSAHSRAGARGLMQIMPVTARHFNIDVHRLADPEVNATIAARLLKSIESTLGFDDGSKNDDKLSIVLAAYNCGIGTVGDARRLASAHGDNPDSWSDVAHYLTLMGDNSFSCSKVTYRRFRGGDETLSFVDGVKRQYSIYLNSVA